MSITIIAVAVAILAMLFAVYRLVDRVLLIEDQPELVDTEETLSELDQLAHRRAMILAELKDIELDHELGKISDEDFSRLSKRYRSDWLAIDKQLDEVAGLEARYLADVEAELEERIDVEVLTGERRRRADRVVCGECGAANAVRLNHCRECGIPMKSDEGLEPVRAS